MSLPWPLLWLIDPAGAYWARRDPVPRGTVFRQAAVFGPDVPGGSRQATDEEIADLEAAAAGHTEEHRAALEDVERRFAPALRAAAQRLVDEGTADLRVGDREVEARLVRFWRGDSLLETRTTAPGAAGESRTRVPRHPGPDDLVPHLADASTG